MLKLATLTLAASFMASGSQAPAPGTPPASPGAYLYVWAGDDDEKESDFLAVIDARPASSAYGQVVATLPVGVKATMPHHIEYETSSGTTLFANGWKGNHSFVIDIADPLKPRLVADFTSLAGYSYAHSFARLPNGNVVATFQSLQSGGKYAPPGGLVEIDSSGKAVRSAPSATADIPTQINWPYSLAVVPAADRIVTTSTDMGMGPDWTSPPTNHVQIWSMSGLKLLASVPLPANGDNGHHQFPAEPRVLADGSLYVNTFNCGLYRIKGLTTGKPTAEFVHAFPGGTSAHDMCAVPVVYGKYWIQTVGALNGLVVLDASNPDRPVEVSRLSLPMRYHMPHWIGADRSSGRLVVTGQKDSWVLMLRFDETTGQLSIDDRFASKAGEPGVEFDRASWPHGDSGAAFVHGAIFSR